MEEDGQDHSQAAAVRTLLIHPRAGARRHLLSNNEAELLATQVSGALSSTYHDRVSDVTSKCLKTCEYERRLRHAS